VSTKIQPVISSRSGGGSSEIYVLPTDEEFLREILTYIFETYWQEIVFGPIIEGGAFEFRCPCSPLKITLFDGYLTVHFGGTHFHICIGENRGAPNNPTPIALRKHRRTSRAEIVRRLDKEGGANSWCLQLFNGHDEQLLSIFFANPFLTAQDGLAEQPDWSKLAMWEDIGQRYLGRELDGTDRASKGFR